MSNLNIAVDNNKNEVYRTVIYTDRELNLFRDAPNGNFYSNRAAAEAHAAYLRNRGLDASIQIVGINNQF